MRTALTTYACDWVNALVAFVYPEVCQLCGAARATPAQCYVCGACRAAIRFIEPPFCSRCGLPVSGEITHAFECANCRDMRWQFVSARSAVVAREEVLELLHRYKYGRAFWFEPLLAGFLVQCARRELRSEDWDWIVPVPLYPARQREREFNQAERLAKWLSAATGIPLITRCLRRVLPTPTQTLLSREQRLANVRKAFALDARARELQACRIVLVDDVFTTGATTGACASVLRSGGSGDVCVWTVARGI